MSLIRKEIREHQRRRIFGEVMLARTPGFLYLTSASAGVLVLSLILITTVEFNRKESVQGWLAPKGGLVQVRLGREGQLSRVLVKEGDLVVKGQELVFANLDQESNFGLVGSQTLSEIEGIEGQIEAQIERDRELLDSRASITTRRCAALARSINNLENEAAIIEESTSISKKILERMEKLNSSGHISVLEVERLRVTFLNERSKLSAKQRELESLVLRREECVLDLQVLTHEHKESLSRLRQDLMSLRREKLQASLSTELVLRAPLAGVVTLLDGSEGQRKLANQLILTIAPRGTPIEAQLLVSPKVIGFVKVGQSVNLMIDAYPQEKFGYLSGVVRSVSTSTFNRDDQLVPVDLDSNVYQVYVTLEATAESWNQNLRLLPGMSVSADLILEKRTLFEWIFRPIFALKSRLE